MLVSQPKIVKKIIKPPILAFKIIQGHWIWRQSRASVQLFIRWRHATIVMRSR